MGLYTEAITAAVQADADALPDGLHLLYSNRCVALMKLQQFERALGDAEKCVAAPPDWAKGHLRHAACCIALNRANEAFSSYLRAEELDPSNKETRRLRAALGTVTGERMPGGQRQVMPTPGGLLTPEVLLALLLSCLFTTRYQMNQGRDQAESDDEEK